MAENKKGLESILKSKLVGYFLALWGLTFLIRSVADFEYYIFNWGGETIFETSTWLVYDVVALAAGVVLLLIAAKILKAKN